jgi:streptogramin lyase
MTDLKDRLDRELSTIIPAVGSRAAVDRRVDRRRRRRRMLLPVVTLLVTAAIVTGLTFAFTPSPPPPGPADTTEISMPGEPFQAIVDGDALWVLTSEPGCDGPACAGFVVKVDTVQREVIAQVPVTSPHGPAAGAGSVWVASFADDTVLRIDPATARVEATIPLTLPFEVAKGDRAFLPFDLDANDDGVWVSTARGAVAHIDPATNEVVAVVPLPPESLGGVAIGRDGIWLDNGLGGLIRVDPGTHEVEELGSIDDEAGRRLSVGTPVVRDGSLWMVGNWARPVEEFGERSYEATEREALVRIDERTGEVASIIDLPKEATWASLLEDGDLWLVEGGGASMRRLDTATGELGPRVTVPFGRPIAVAGSMAWSAVGNDVRSWALPDVSDEPGS